VGAANFFPIFLAPAVPEESAHQKDFAQRRRHRPALAPSFDLEQFRQSRKIEGHLARFVESQNAGPHCHAWVRPAVKHAQPVPSGILDCITVLQFEHLPGREATSSDRPDFGHIPTTLLPVAQQCSEPLPLT